MCHNEDRNLHMDKEVLPCGNKYIYALRSVLRVSAAPSPCLERKAKGKQETHISGPGSGSLMCVFIKRITLRGNGSDPKKQLLKTHEKLN